MVPVERDRARPSNPRPSTPRPLVCLYAGANNKIHHETIKANNKKNKLTKRIRMRIQSMEFITKQRDRTTKTKKRKCPCGFN